MDTRFTRIETLPAARPRRLCGRNEVNPALSFDEAMNNDAFLSLLAARFGPPPVTRELGPVFPIRDAVTGVSFEAFVSPDGPSYGGARNECYEDVAHGDLRLRPEVIQALGDFEAWLTES